MPFSVSTPGGWAARRPTRDAMIPCSAREPRHPLVAAGVGRRLAQHPDDALGRDLGRLPVGVVELGGVGEESLGRDRDVDAERVHRDPVRSQLRGERDREVLERGLGHAVGHLARGSS